MGLKLLRINLFILFLTAAFAAVPFSGFAQTALSPGDLVLVTVNSDGDDNFDFVPLADLEAGTIIQFTDDAWDPDNSQFRGGEGIITYTAPAAVTAGTVVSYSGTDENGFEQTSGSFNTSGSGDNILVYQGTESSPSFLYGVGFARGNSVWTFDDDTNSSGIPSELSESANTILFLGTSDNLQYDTSNGTEGTKNTIVDIVGNESNWNEDNDNAFAPLNATFTLVNPPTVRFTTDEMSVDESGGPATITVELAESSGDPVSVDVAFLSSSSTASSADIDNYSTQTVSFTSSDNSGATRDVTVNLTDDNNFEGEEKAVFRLQNNNAGSIIEPNVFTLTIADNDAPDIVFNEINADPGDDANGDGTLDSDTDEFIEWVNNSGQDIDISGWVYADNNSDRFTFPEGTVIAAGNAVVLFDNSGGAEPQGNFGAAYVFSDGEIELNNSPETLTLRDSDGNVIETATYDNDAAGESNNLNPDGTGTTYADHSSLSPSGALSSPGTQVDGTIWGDGTFGIAFRGNEGYRFVSTPAQNTTFNDLFAELWTQGFTDADAPSADANIFSWDESGGGAFGVIGGQGNIMNPGQGYIIYAFEDDDFDAPGVQGGFPKVINTDNPENDDEMMVAVSANDANSSGGIDGNEGFNLLGNPYGIDISVDGVIAALRNVDPSINANIHIWDHQAGNYVIHAEGEGARIAPFQAFFVRYTDEVSGNASFGRSDLAANIGTQFFGQPGQNEPIVSFEMFLGNGNKFDDYKIEFREEGTIGEDLFDAYKLFSLNANAINFYSTVGDGVRLSKNVLPSVDSFRDDSELRVPFRLDVPFAGNYTFSWSGLQQVPEEIDLILVDNRTGQRIDMRVQEELQFSTGGEETRQTVRKELSPSLSSTETDSDAPRFELIIAATASDDDDDDSTTEPEQPVSLSTNYPNPFSTQTTMNLTLTEKMHVNMTVWNIVGQKVGTMMNETMEAVEEKPMRWNVPTNMPSGIYICKVEAGGMVITRKMTLVK